MMLLKGRRVIYTDSEAITEDNVIAEVNAAKLVHDLNRQEIQKLYDIFRGDMDIESKVKEIRPEINHKIVENRAYEIEKFYAGYTFGSPIQYVRREKSEGENKDDAIADDINKLNAYMSDISKASCDTELAEWMLIAGTSFRLVLPNTAWTKDSGEPPFEVYTLDPRNSFVIYHSGYRHQPIAAVTYVDKKNGGTLYNVYTKDEFFEYSTPGIEYPKNPGQEADPMSAAGIRVTRNELVRIPIIEYPLSNARLGIFEPVIRLIDAINELQSNRMDDIVQFVNNYLTILGGDMDEATYEKANEMKLLCLPNAVDAKYIGKQMSEVDVQTLKDDLYMAILTITGMPNRNGGRSTSDTGAATQLRDGWEAAEARASDIETNFKKAEQKFIDIIIDIMQRTAGTGLVPKDIEAHFTRRNYENIVSKAQVLTTMLENGKIHPELAFTASGMFVDSEGAYLQSKEYIEEQRKREVNDDPDTGSNQMSNMSKKATGLAGNVPNTMSKVQINYNR